MLNQKGKVDFSSAWDKLMFKELEESYAVGKSIILEHFQQANKTSNQPKDKASAISKSRKSEKHFEWDDELTLPQAAHDTVLFVENIRTEVVKSFSDVQKLAATREEKERVVAKMNQLELEIQT